LNIGEKRWVSPDHPVGNRSNSSLNVTDISLSADCEAAFAGTKKRKMMHIYQHKENIL
jgi:hypothetical protein